MMKGAAKWVVVAGLAGALACGAPELEPQPAGSISDSEEALVADAAVVTASCGDRYAAALDHYRRAVAGAKNRLRDGVCNDEDDTLWTISDEASRAVMTCDAFRQVIKTSVWARPLRDALAVSLTLRSLTGELKVIRDSAWQDWSGVEAFFPGTSMWARAVGAYGPPVRIDFAAQGAAVYGQQSYDPVTGDISWVEGPATYHIETTGQARDKRTVVVTHEGRQHRFLLSVEPALPDDWKSAPSFTLLPSGQHEKLSSIVVECDA